MMLPRLILIPFVLFFDTASARPAELYVDATAGMDTNPGLAARPLKTLAAAMDQAVGGDTIFLQPGKYGPINPKVGVDRNVFDEQYVTIRPAPEVVEPRKKIFIQRLSFGVRSGVLTGNDRKGVYDIYLRVKGVCILDGVYVYGGRHLEIIDCRIQRTPPWTGSADAIEKFAVKFGAGDELLVSECEITDTAGGVTNAPFGSSPLGPPLGRYVSRAMPNRLMPNTKDGWVELSCCGSGSSTWLHPLWLPASPTIDMRRRSSTAGPTVGSVGRMSATKSKARTSDPSSLPNTLSGSSSPGRNQLSSMAW
jgi:hypothetical protein